MPEKEWKVSVVGDVIQASHGLSHWGPHCLSSIFLFIDVLDLLCLSCWESHVGIFFSFFWIGYQLYISVLSSSAAVCLCYLTRPWVLWNQRYAFHVCVFSAWYTVSSQQLSDLGMTECINALLKLLLLELLPFWPWLGSLLFSRVKEGVHRLRISSSSQKYQKAFLCYF